jgi:hypothetical protein
MKKLFGLVLCLGFVLAASLAYAAPVGNVATPSLLKKGIIWQDDKADYAVVSTLDVDLTWDQNLKNQDNDTEYYYYGGKIGLVVMNRFMPYAMLGTAEAKKQTYRIGSDKVRWDTKYDFVWGVGGTAVLYETGINQLGGGTLRIGVDGNYRQSHLKVDKVSLNNTEIDASRVTQSRYELEQWQVALGVSYQADKFIPYAGVKYSDSTGEAVAKIDGTSYKNSFKNKNNVGIFVGADLLVHDSFTANVEGRFIDETALSVGGALRF